MQNLYTITSHRERVLMHVYSQLLQTFLKIIKYTRMNIGATGEGSPVFHQLLAGGGDFLGKGAVVFMGT